MNVFSLLPGEAVTVPCFHFSWESYGQWSPVAPANLAVAGQRLLPDRVVAARYQNEVEPEACLDEELQRLLLSEAKLAAEQAECRLHVAAADAATLNVVLSWNDARSPDLVRQAIRDAIGRRLHAAGVRTWLSHRGARRRLVDRFDYDRFAARLLARPRCWKWTEFRGVVR